MNGEEVKELRQKLKLSQEKFAHLIGVAFGTVNRWERGSGNPSGLAQQKLKELKRITDEKNE